DERALSLSIADFGSKSFLDVNGLGMTFRLKAGLRTVLPLPAKNDRVSASVPPYKGRLLDVASLNPFR
ncbi:MAG: hypothetical protein ABI882_13325, partial [Acidobacteriota bacterium]